MLCVKNIQHEWKWQMNLIDDLFGVPNIANGSHEDQRSCSLSLSLLMPASTFSFFTSFV